MASAALTMSGTVGVMGATTELVARMHVFSELLYPLMSKAFLMWCSVNCQVRSFNSTTVTTVLSYTYYQRWTINPEKIQGPADQVVSWSHVGGFTTFKLSVSQEKTAISLTTCHQKDARVGYFVPWRQQVPHLGIRFGSSGGLTCKSTSFECGPND